MEGGQCPLPGPRREGIRPKIIFEIEEFRKVLKNSKNQGGEEDAPKKNEEEELVDKRIIQARDEDVEDMRGFGPFKVEDKDIGRYPSSAVGAVVSKDGSIGTGCLIGPNIVLTCGHNCYRWNFGREFR